MFNKGVNFILDSLEGYHKDLIIVEASLTKN